MTISEQLTQVNTEKQALKTAFTNLGFDMSSVPFTSYHTLVGKLVVGVGTSLTSSISNSTPHFGASLTITGTLTDSDSNVLSGQTITLYDGTTQLNTATTDSTGTYSFTYTVSSMTSPNLNVAFESNGLYLSSTSTIPSLTIGKADTVITLTANPTTVDSGGSTTLTVTLKDEWGNDLNGETVQILNGTDVLYSGIIINNSFTQSYSPTATISLKSNYIGSTNYNISSSNAITLTLIGTVLFSPNLTGSDTWHNISSPNSITVSSGVASGYNKMLDNGWSNNSDWTCTLKVKFGNGRGGILLANVSNTTDYDSSTYQIVNNSGIKCGGQGSDWSNLQTIAYGSSTWYDCKIIKTSTSVNFYINNTLIGTLSTPYLSTTENVTIGFYTWSSTTQNLKNIIVKSS